MMMMTTKVFLEYFSSHTFEPTPSHFCLKVIMSVHTRRCFKKDLQPAGAFAASHPIIFQ